jgi:hypothetical protein
MASGCFHGDVKETKFGMATGSARMNFKWTRRRAKKRSRTSQNDPPGFGERYRVWADFPGNSGHKKAISMFEPIKIEPSVC